MRAGNGETLHAEVASVLGWWTLAGVTTAVDERARDWLAPVAAPSATAPMVVADDALPGMLDDFLAWLAASGDDALLGPVDARLAPGGDRAARLMVLIDMPGPDDAYTGAFLSGAAGALLDRMLAAIGASRAAVWLAPLVPARPAGGRIDAARLARLGRIARHHAGLIGAERVLLMGAPAVEAVLERRIDAARGSVHTIDGRQVAATFSPQALLGAPGMKAGAWADLRQMIGDEQ